MAGANSGSVGRGKPFPPHHSLDTRADRVPRASDRIVMPTGAMMRARRSPEREDTFESTNK